MRVAVIGTGIAGNAAAWALHHFSPHEIVVYEKEARAGGHSATVDVDYDGHTIAVDTGFIVYNELNYPNLTQLFAQLGVKTEPSNMSFSVSSKGGLFEWSGQPTKILDGLFAQRRNIISPKHFKMIAEVFRFNREAVKDRREGRLEGLTLGAYLDQARYSKRFREDYLVPMGAAIWSTSLDAMLDFPALSFVTFFENHRLLHWQRPIWRTVTGGSRSYVAKLTASLGDRIRLDAPVKGILRHDLGVDVIDASGRHERFDQVIVATHSDQALALLGDASEQEREVLGPIRYAPNDVWLHRDPRLMPKRKAAWSSWNVLKDHGGPEGAVSVTYWMNVLQNIDQRYPLFVSLNPPFAPREEMVFGRYSYDHPQFDKGALDAQRQLDTIQGARRTWFCGAWATYGFHEDGLVSGLKAAEALGALVPWRVAERRLVEAAE